MAHKNFNELEGTLGMLSVVSNADLMPSYAEALDLELAPHRTNRLTYASFFCGGGGLDLGFSASGFQGLFSSDIEETYCATIRANLPDHEAIPYDISSIDSKEVKGYFRGRRPSVVIGGPPCQSFSILGRRGSTNDPRGRLTLAYAKLIKEISPKAFLLENVPGLLTINQGRDWENLYAFFKDTTGFHLTWKVLNSVWYGVPQHRRRLFLVGFKYKKHAKRFEWPQARFAEHPSQASIDLLDPVPSRVALQGISESVPNHILRKHGERVRRRYSQVLPGSRDRKDHTDRIHPDRPSGTVLVGSGAGGGRPFIHPIEHRHITTREAARLQSFPDWWEFAGGPTAAYRQVGNAVPPLLAKGVASSIARCICDA